MSRPRESPAITGYTAAPMPAGTRDDPQPRPSARVIVVDPDDRVFLFEARLPDGRRLWLMPGGGLDPGESWEQGARRELWEETGQKVTSLGPCVWRRRVLWQAQVERIWFDSDERYFLLRSQPFEQRWAKPSEIERRYILGHRWWPPPEIAEASDELFVPTRLASLLPPPLRGELPAEPIDVGR